VKKGFRVVSPKTNAKGVFQKAHDLIKGFVPVVCPKTAVAWPQGSPQSLFVPLCWRKFAWVWLAGATVATRVIDPLGAPTWGFSKGPVRLNWETPPPRVGFHRKIVAQGNSQLLLRAPRKCGCCVAFRERSCPKIEGGFPVGDPCLGPLLGSWFKISLPLGPRRKLTGALKIKFAGRPTRFSNEITWRPIAVRSNLVYAVAKFWVCGIRPRPKGAN